MTNFNSTDFYDATESERQAEIADCARRGKPVHHIPTPTEIAAEAARLRRIAMEQPSPAMFGAVKRRARHA